jgi:membrane associated rhomboid family serine protease
VLPLNVSGTEQAVAWEAHIGGFLAGLFLFAAFDPVPRQADHDAGPNPSATIH